MNDNIGDVVDCLQWFTRRPARVQKMEVPFRGTECSVTILDFMNEASSHYSESFGIQFGRYRDVQIDRFNGVQHNSQMLNRMVFNQIHELRGRTVLEIGSGAGRFTDLLVDLGGTICTVEPSALLTNVALGAQNLIPVRADLFDIPINRKLIDVVFCRGVLQFTPSPRAAIIKLFDYVKPGGLVIFNIYPLRWFTPLTTKYWLRPLMRNISSEQLFTLAERWVPRLLKIKQKYIMKVLPNNLIGINIANQLVPIADYTRSSEVGDHKNQIDWSVYDTINMYAPHYDRPMTWNSVMRALRSVGARDIRGDRSAFIFNARAPE